MLKYHNTTEAEQKGLALVISRKGSGVIPAACHRGKVFFF